MKGIKQLNKVFISCFLKDWRKITCEEHRDLSTRAGMLNRKFKFTEEVILQLRKLNDILIKEEDRICKHKKQLLEKLENWVAEKVIDDYELDSELSLWNEEYYKQWNEVFDGNPFFTDHYYVHNHKEDDDPRWPASEKKTETDPVTGEKITRYNWNDLGTWPDHPLANEFYCYTLHHIIDHAPLAWEDILRIEGVWLELQVRHQLLIKV